MNRAGDAAATRYRVALGVARAWDCHTGPEKLNLFSFNHSFSDFLLLSHMHGQKNTKRLLVNFCVSFSTAKETWTEIQKSMGLMFSGHVFLSYFQFLLQANRRVSCLALFDRAPLIWVPHFREVIAFQSVQHPGPRVFRVKVSFPCSLGLVLGCHLWEKGKSHSQQLSMEYPEETRVVFKSLQSAQWYEMV